MSTTVYFATNRVVNGPAEKWESYQPEIVSPSDPAAVTYASAFIDQTDLNADKTGAILSIQDARRGGFSPQIVNDLSNAGRNLLIFIHGFANSFDNALTRAAFNREWLARSGAAAADTTVIAFSWPSAGEVLSFPIVTADYRRDQTMSGQSAPHIMSFFTNLEPIITQARANGQKVFLLAHSMGSRALQAAVESWFSHGNGDASLFDEALLCAADERYDGFDFPPTGMLSGLDRLAKRISIYFSAADAVLQISMAVNLGAKRLGQDGPHSRFDKKRFPAAKYRMVDCGGFRDFDFGFTSSHQYYRRSPLARNDIVKVMTGS